MLPELVRGREAWHAVIYGVTKSRTRLSDWTELNWTIMLSCSAVARLPSWLSRYRICLQCRKSGFDSWVGKIPLEKEMATHSSILAWRILMGRGAWEATVHGVAESDTTQQLNHHQSLSHVQLFATPWTIACQAPLSMGLSWQEYWSGLPFPPLGDLPDPWVKPVSPPSPTLVHGFFLTEPSGKSHPNTISAALSISLVSILFRIHINYFSQRLDLEVELSFHKVTCGIPSWIIQNGPYWILAGGSLDPIQKGESIINKCKITNVLNVSFFVPTL